MRIRTLSAAAAALAVAGAALLPISAANASEPGSPASTDRGITRITGPEGDGVVMEDISGLRWGDGYARVESVAGGTWQYGTTNGTYSNFKHGTKKHGSTAKNGRGESMRVTNVGGGTWSKATIGKTLADNQAYYHFS